MTVSALFISLPMMVGLFWGSYLFLRQLSQWRIDKRDLILQLFFYVALLLYMCHFVYFIGYRSVLFGTMYGVMNLLMYPMFYWYLCELTGHPLRHADVVWMCVPSAVVMVGYPLIYYLSPEWMPYFRWVQRIFFIGMVVYVGIRGYRMLRAYRVYLDNTYSDGRSYNLLMVRVLLWLFVVFSLIALLFGVLGPESLYTNWHTLPSLSISLFLFWMGYVTTQLTVEAEVAMMEEDVADEAGKVLSVADKQLCEHLERLMEDERLYLNPVLTIVDVARLLSTNRTYASQLINNAYGVNFASFIGRYRVEYAKDILADRRYGHAKEAIADAVATSGFTNEQTFYRVFKEHTGLTPHEFRAKALREI
ncbi:MAG: helix-turn-helix domain-containing protein [Paludibacteraceae bacterium]|nr:helix-turn-helix domain-containing protein [Paludibacteraceae bacterium]